MHHDFLVEIDKFLSGHWGFNSHGGTPKSFTFNRVFPYKQSSYWGTNILGNLYLCHSQRGNQATANETLPRIEGDQLSLSGEPTRGPRTNLVQSGAPEVR